MHSAAARSSPRPCRCFATCFRIVLGVDELSLTLADLGELQQDVLVIGLELERLFVERRRLRKKPFGELVIGNADELLDRLRRCFQRADTDRRAR